MIIYDILLVTGAYLLGSMPHLKMLAKLKHIELEGDFHQDLYRRAGKVTGVLGVIGEFIKGVTPVLAGKALDFDITVVALAGLAAVCGQMWPAFSRFDGEKGNSIAIAMSFSLVPVATLYGIIPVIISLIFRTVPRLLSKNKQKGIVGGAYSRSLPLGMAACFIVIPFAAWVLGEPAGVVWCMAALFVLMIVVRRITAGLRRDLASGEKLSKILCRRLLYDRAAVEWRQEPGTGR